MEKNYSEKLPQGFSLAVVEAGFKYQNRPDLTLILSSTPAVCAGVFTTNIFQAAPVLIARDNLKKSGTVRAILVNAGQANACTGEKGIANCLKTLEIAADKLQIDHREILPASTGVIGDHLKMDLFEKNIPLLVENLGKAKGEDAARSIMTTDTFPKTAQTEVELEKGKVRFWGMAKGAGMICPNMATMLGFILTDFKVDRLSWQELIARAADQSFNALTIDGDTSTNDCVLAIANGRSGVESSGQKDMQMVEDALNKICSDLSYQIVKDAEGGTKVLQISVQGAADRVQAKLAASTVGNSPLVKTAMYGQDPNWGRIIAALGRSGAKFDPDKVRVSLAGIEIFSSGRPVDMDRDAVFASLLKGRDVKIEIDLGKGSGSFSLLASDFTEEYIKINAHYRT